MDKTTGTGTRAFSQSRRAIISFDDVDPSIAESGKANDFLSQLETVVANNRIADLQSLIEQQPDAWSRVDSTALGKLVLAAVKKGYSRILGELIEKSAPGKVAALPMELQLALVEAARCQRDSQAEMSSLLDVLLRDAAFPVQHLEHLMKEVRSEKRYQLLTALSDYKNSFLKAREREPVLAIFDAAASGDPVKLLKELDAKLGIPPVDDSLTGVAWFFSALHRWVAELFAAGAARTLVNQKMENEPLLHAAVASGNEETVLLLLERGADISAVDRQGQTALWKAREQNSNGIVALLVKHGDPAGATDPGAVPAPTQAAGRRSMNADDESIACGSSRKKENAPRRHLLDVGSQLSESQVRELAKKLNNNPTMTAAQARLFTAGYMADFQASRAVDGGGRPREFASTGSDEFDSFQSGSACFRAEGVSLEAAMEMDLHQVLDSLTWNMFDVQSHLPFHVQDESRMAGLCDLLAAVIEQAYDSAMKNSEWGSASHLRRKELFGSCLQGQLRQLSEQRSALNGQDTPMALAESLLGRQIALLEKYCKAAKDVRRKDDGNTTDFSASFY